MNRVGSQNGGNRARRIFAAKIKVLLIYTVFLQRYKPPIWSYMAEHLATNYSSYGGHLQSITYWYVMCVFPHNLIVLV